MLSKGVSRAQYLLGLVLGSTVFGGVYFVAVAASLLWLLGTSAAELYQGAILVISGVVAMAWIAALALLFSVFLHPMLAAAVSGAIAFAPLAMTSSSMILPLTTMIRGMSSLPGSQFAWPSIFIALLESAIFVLVGSPLFQRSDVAVNLE